MLSLGVCWFAIGCAFVALLPATLASPIVYRKDLVAEYLFTLALGHGVDPYMPTDQLAGRFRPGIPVTAFPHPTPYPPLTGALFVPFATLGFPTFAAIWLGIELICLVLSVRLLLIGARLELGSGRDTTGGILLGLAVLLKPIAWPLAVGLVLRGQWRSASAAGLIVLLGYAASAWLVGVSAFRLYFLDVLPEIGRGYVSFSENQSLWTLGYRLFSGTDWARFADGDLAGVVAMPLLNVRSAAPVVSIAIPALLLAGFCWLVRRESIDRVFGILLCISILVSPIAWDHYLVLLMIPCARLIASLRAAHFPPGQTRAALLIGAILLMPYSLWDRLALSGAQSADVALASPVSFAAGLCPWCWRSRSSSCLAFSRSSNRRKVNPGNDASRSAPTSKTGQRPVQ